MNPDEFVSRFRQAGIDGLTPNHFVQQSHIEALAAYFREPGDAKTQEAYRDDSLVESKIVVVQEVNERLLQQLASLPKLMHNLGPRRFEELVARLLEDQGCEVTLTKRTRDGGYDILGRTKSGPANLVFLAECKRYAPERKVGVEVVRGLYGVTEMQRANLGIVITTSSFTKDAYEEKVRIGPRMDLKDFSDLQAWLAPYANT
jgi:restriction system protein